MWWRKKKNDNQTMIVLASIGLVVTIAAIDFISVIVRAWKEKEPC